MTKKMTKQQQREQELLGNISLNEYQEVESGYSVFESTQDYFKRQALENAEYTHNSEPMLADILAVKLCKNSNIMLFVKLPSGFKTNVFLTPAEAKALGINVPIRAVYGTSPKGVNIILGYEIDTSKDILDSLFKHKKAVVTKLNCYVVTEIY